MPNLEINWKGVHKLLKGLKTFKATLADSIPDVILKAAANQLSQSSLYRYAKPRDQLERCPLTAQRLEYYSLVFGRVRLASWNRLKPSSKIFHWPFQGGTFLWTFYFFLSCVCYAFVCVCWYVPCVHLLGKGWPLVYHLWCLTVSLLLSHWYSGSCVVFDCIDSWSLHPYLLSR